METDNPMTDDQEYERVYQVIMQLAEKQSQLARMARAQYEPMVDAIIRKKVTDEKQITSVLDGVLSFCFDDEMLVIFKRLCRYYYPLAPETVAFYVRTYRDMWEEDPDDACQSEPNESTPAP